MSARTTSPPPGFIEPIPHGGAAAPEANTLVDTLPLGHRVAWQFIVFASLAGWAVWGPGGLSWATGHPMRWDGDGYYFVPSYLSWTVPLVLQLVCAGVNVCVIVRGFRRPGLWPLLTMSLCVVTIGLELSTVWEALVRGIQSINPGPC